jgi:hypothetical protein
MTYQILNTENSLQDPRWRPCIKAAEYTQPTGATTYCLRRNLADAVRTLIQFDSYRPELHYMRGAGPKWHAKHVLAFASLNAAIGSSRNDNECCAPRQRLPIPLLASSYRGMPTLSTKNEDAVRDANNEARRNASLAVKRADSMMLRIFKNWPNTTFAVICTAAIFSVVFPLTIATSLIASSSSLVNAEPPGNGCVAVSQGEYQGAYRKKLLFTRFGAYERTGRLGRYDYWYCH